MRSLPKWLDPRYLLPSFALTIASIFCCAASTRAAEIVFLRYKNIRTTVPFRDIEDFATDGTTSEALQAFLESTSLAPDLMATLLAAEIPDRGIPLGPTDVQFVLFQLNKLVGDPFDREEPEALARSLRSAYSDKNLSVLEIVRRYPESEVRLDLGRLSRVYRDVDLFVQRLSTLFAFFEELLPDLVCECEVATARETLLSQDNLAIAGVKGQDKPDCDRSENFPAMGEEMMGFPAREASSPVREEATILAQSFSPRPSRTAEEVILVFGPLQFNFAIADLTTFAETGKVPEGWKFFMAQANLKPENLQTILTSETEVDPLFIHRLLNNLLGEYALFQLGRVIHTPSRTANVQSLRSAIVLSALDDGKISLLEFLGNFPTRQAIVEVKELIGVGKSLQRRGVVPSITGNLEDLLVEIQRAIAEDICECKDPKTISRGVSR
ncbi:MAG: alpha/beta hydrolase [Spirulina sp.]